MGSTYFSLHYHIVFSTKHRRPLLRDESLARMHSYLGGIIRGMNGVAEIVGGVADHAHMLVSLRSVHCLAEVMRDLKKDSTNWAKAELDRRFSWQEGYAAFTVSPTATEAVRKYIANQEAHHAKRTFVDELKEPSGFDLSRTLRGATLSHRRIRWAPLRCHHRPLSASPAGLVV